MLAVSTAVRAARARRGVVPRHAYDAVEASALRWASINGWCARRPLDSRPGVTSWQGLSFSRSRRAGSHPKGSLASTPQQRLLKQRRHALKAPLWLGTRHQPTGGKLSAGKNSAFRPQPPALELPELTFRGARSRRCRCGLPRARQACQLLGSSGHCHLVVREGWHVPILGRRLDAPLSKVNGHADIFHVLWHRLLCQRGAVCSADGWLP
mmetsp:Transcript_83715/g.249881  ORF Transcript_83715/g.249881 Transcript_83715/m.249881 type:complete len:210 (-) Transcript_83715:139-768(-)